jgi:hypothetical protein
MGQSPAARQKTVHQQVARSSDKRMREGFVQLVNVFSCNGNADRGTNAEFFGFSEPLQHVVRIAAIGMIAKGRQPRQ